MFKKIIEGIFTPAVTIMGRLWYWQKFMLLTTLFTIPIGFAISSYITLLDKSIIFAEKEITGIQYSSPLLSFLQHTQQHRGEASIYLRGDPSFKTILEGKEREIQNDIARTDAEDQKSGIAFESTEDWNAIKQKWLALKEEYITLTPTESYGHHTALTSDIIALLHRIGDESNLILDPVLPSYEVMNTIINVLPTLTENMGRARAFGLSVKNPGKISDEERKQFIIYANTARIENSKLQNGIRESFGNDPSLRAVLEVPSKEIDTEIKSFVALTEQAVSSEKIPLALPEYYAFMTHIIDTHFSFSTHLVSVLTGLIENRIAQAEKEKHTTILITFWAYVLILYFFIGFYLLVARTVRELEDITKQLIAGKMEEVSIRGQDELGDVGKSFTTIGRALIASTQDLHGKIDDLERFNKLMINRELKMIELKKEIEELKKKQNSL